MNSKDYPSFRYAENESPRIVAHDEEDKALGPKWLDTYDPEALAAANLATLQEYAGDDAQQGTDGTEETALPLVAVRKPGRPRKVAAPAAAE
jgi:hypothetical protein